jgi:hypothetical protein
MDWASPFFWRRMLHLTGGQLYEQTQPGVNDGLKTLLFVIIILLLLLLYWIECSPPRGRHSPLANSRVTRWVCEKVDQKTNFFVKK